VDHGAPKVGIAGVTLGSEHAQATLVSLEVEDLVARHLGMVAGAIEVHVVRRGTDAAQDAGWPGPIATHLGEHKVADREKRLPCTMTSHLSLSICLIFEEKSNFMSVLFQSLLAARRRDTRSFSWNLDGVARSSNGCALKVLLMLKNAEFPRVTVYLRS